MDATPGPPPVVTKISAKIDSRKMVWIRMTTVIARARCGRMIQRNFEPNPAPSISAASSCSLDSDWIAVSRISVAKGSHCQDTIRMIDISGAAVSHSKGCAPKMRET